MFSLMTLRTLRQHKCLMPRAATILSIHQPDYLKYLDPMTPVHERLNIFVSGYDYTLVEHFQKYISQVADQLNLTIDESWPLPHKETDVVTYQRKSTTIIGSFKLKTYRRVLQLYRAEPPQVCLLLELLRTALPEGVTLRTKPHSSADVEARYIPNTGLMGLKRELDIMKGVIKVHNKKKN